MEEDAREPAVPSMLCRSAPHLPCELAAYPSSSKMKGQPIQKRFKPLAGIAQKYASHDTLQ